MLHGKKFTQWPWPWKSIGFQILLRTKFVPSLVKIHWRMLILECSQGCYTVTNLPSDQHPCEHSRINILQWILTKLGTYIVLRRVWNSIDFQGQGVKGQGHLVNLLPCNILDSRVFTRMLRGKNLTRWHWPLTLKINRVPDSPKDYVCTKFGQNPLSTYLVLRRVWNPIDFQGQRSRSLGKFVTV
jgi:hypothetical protein